MMNRTAEPSGCGMENGCGWPMEAGSPQFKSDEIVVGQNRPNCSGLDDRMAHDSSCHHSRCDRPKRDSDLGLSGIRINILCAVVVSCCVFCRGTFSNRVVGGLVSDFAAYSCRLERSRALAAVSPR